jgi:hypothetical protein
VPSRTIIVVMIAIFFAISITALLAGFLPAKPAVLPTTGVTYQEVFAQDRQVLDNYAWLNRQEGRVYIPVNRAMDLIAERGLPTRPQTDEQQQP